MEKAQITWFLTIWIFYHVWLFSRHGFGFFSQKMSGNRAKLRYLRSSAFFKVPNLKGVLL